MSDKFEKLYKELVERVREATLIGSIESLLGWDERTYMPRAGAENRANQSAYLSGLMHQKITDPRIGELLSELERSPYMKEEYSNEAVNIRELRHDYDKLVKLPQRLVEEITKTTTMSQGVWAQARGKSDYATFLPWLEKVIDLDIEKAECLGYEKEAYDALLDTYEPGATVETVSKTFSGLRDELVPLVEAIANSSVKPDLSIVNGDYPVDRQATFGREAAAAIGYNFESGRLDITAHPFTTGIGPGDTRITTKYDPKFINQALFGTLHEAGHGIYDQGLDPEQYGTPRGESVSLGIHESQSRMWENMVGRCKPFWRHFFPRAQKIFPEALGQVAFDDFYLSVNDVRPSLIRIEADEVTYNLHIMLRFELEQVLIRKDLKAKDLPEAWNSKFKDFFGITPPDDARGCMQDVHWSAGYFGYFPTYALGNLYAAMFFAKALEEMPDLEEQFAAGQFGQLKKWLNEKIHSHGRRYRAEKLAEVVTGQSLNHKPLMTYLNKKFGELYKL